MRNTKKIISIILVLMIVFMSMPLQVFATPNIERNKIEYKYVVADTNLKDWLTESTDYYSYLTDSSSINIDDENCKNLIISESKWEKKLCNKISSGDVKVYELKDYVRKKASESKYDIDDSVIEKICNLVNYNYFYRNGYKLDNDFCVNANDFYLPKSDAYAKQICLFSNLGTAFFNSPMPNGNTSFFTAVGTFLGDYTDYNNSVHFFGKMNYDDDDEWDSYKVSDSNLDNKYFNENGQLVVYKILIPRTVSSNVSFLNVSNEFILNEELNKIKRSPNFDDYLKIYQNEYKYPEMQEVEQLFAEGQKNDNDYAKYKKVVWSVLYKCGMIIDTRSFYTYFEDRIIPLPNIEGLTFDKLLSQSGAEYTNKNVEIEDENLKIKPYPFYELVDLSANYFSYAKAVYPIYKNTYTYKINFVDEDGKPLDINFKDYQYNNKFGTNDADANTLYIGINGNTNTQQNDFNISSIVWNNESNCFYNSKGELLKQDKENVPSNIDFNMFDNNYDIKIPKSLLNSVDGYTFSEFTQNNEKVTLEETKENNTDYYHLNTDITKGVTTLNVVFKKKSAPNVNNDATVNVKYVDENGKTISDDVVIRGKVNAPYETKSKEIYGYSLIRTPDNAKGFMTSEPINVNYVYRLKNARVIVRYIDKENNEIEDTEVITGKVFDKYTTEAKDIDGYTLSVMPTNATGEMTEEPITVTYIYEQEPEVIVTENDPEEPVDTGDSLPMTLIVMTIIMLMLCIVYILINKKKRANEKE